MSVANDQGMQEHRPTRLCSAEQSARQQHCERTLTQLIEQIKRDPSILAVIQCTDLRTDSLWGAAEIDWVLVTLNERSIPVMERSLVADDINVHVHLLPQATFRQVIEGELHHTLFQTLLTQGTLLYTHDPSLAASYRTFELTCSSDHQMQLMRAGIAILPALSKAHQWFQVKRDLDYTLLWLLSAATPLAQIEVFSQQRLPDQNILAQATALNPAVFQRVYMDLLRMMGQPKNITVIQTALNTLDTYLAERTQLLFQPILDYLEWAGEARSASEINAYFLSHMDVKNATTACEYLWDQGWITKVSCPVKLTPLSPVEVPELAFALGRID
jgi:hypothetical protein